MYVHGRSQEPLESAETGALYQDPGEIKREEYPGTHDFYAQPEIKRKTHKPEDHLPTYGDPRDLNHVEAPETGELYAVSTDDELYIVHRPCFIHHCAHCTV